MLPKQLLREQKLDKQTNNAIEMQAQIPFCIGRQKQTVINVTQNMRKSIAMAALLAEIDCGVSITAYQKKHCDLAVAPGDAKRDRH